MLELPSGVAADMGVPGMAFSSPGVDPVAPTSIDMFVWLLLGTRAVKGIAWLLPTLWPIASWACPSACAISASLK